MSYLGSTFRFGLVSLSLCAPLGSQATAQSDDLPVIAIARTACKDVPDDQLKKSIETSLAFGIANANIDRRANGEQEMPHFKFEYMPPERTDRFIKRLRETGENVIAGPGEKIVVQCSDFTGPKLGS